MNTIIRRVLAFILSFALIFATTVRANANTSIGGWTATDSLIAGANTTINAAKTAGGKALKSSITVAASASKVGKYLIKGGGNAAIAYAMVELADGAIDWVLDPANNAVKYKPVAGGGDGSAGAGDPLVYSYNESFAPPLFSSAVAAATARCAKSKYPNFRRLDNLIDEPSRKWAYAYCSAPDKPYVDVFNQDIFSVWGKANPAYDGSGSGSDGYKSIPIDTVAAKVISNAEAGHAPSQEAVKATALEGFAAGEHDAALDAAAVPDTGVENPPDTENPPKDPDAPAEPFDPAGIISAINALKALLAGILSSITSLSDWFQSEPPPEPKPEDTEIDIPMPDLPTPDTDINFGGSCPANFEFNGSIFGNPINIVLLDTSKFCGFLSTFVKFPVYAASSLFALYILGGRKDG